MRSIDSSGQLMRRAQVGAITFICILGPVLLLLRLTQRVLVHAITICFIVAAFGGIGTWWVAKASRNRFLRSGLGGIDLNKPGAKDAKVKVPEALGLVAGCMFLLCVVSFQVIYSGTFKGRWHQEGDVYEASWQVEYNAGMASICFMLLLGFADDVLDIPWRIKIIMPLFASLPLLVGYSGHTAVAVPLPLRGIHVPLLGQLGDMLELGVLYKVAVGLVVVFCTNSINILAGVNGLEVGQTCILSSAVLIFNIARMAASPGDTSVEGAHMLSVFLLTPLLGTSLGLLSLNWYPSQVFVGDTYTFFAGMVLGVAGTLGHFIETLMIFFLPQLINFVYSMPQAACAGLAFIARFMLAGWYK